MPGTGWVMTGPTGTGQTKVVEKVEVEKRFAIRGMAVVRRYVE